MLIVVGQTVLVGEIKSECNRRVKKERKNSYRKEDARVIHEESL